MPQTERTFTVTAPLTTVVEYLKDFGHAEEWDPGTVSCTREDSGPVTVGSSWHNVSKFAGQETELTYTLRHLEADHLVFVGENKTATSTDDISLTPSPDGGTTLTYHADIEFHGVAKLAGPLLAHKLESLGDETEESMIGVLNGLGHQVG